MNQLKRAGSLRKTFVNCATALAVAGYGLGAQVAMAHSKWNDFGDWHKKPACQPSAPEMNSWLVGAGIMALVAISIVSGVRARRQRFDI